MKYILFWFYVTAMGGVTSGSIEFENRAACVAGFEAIEEQIKKRSDWSISGFRDHYFSGCLPNKLPDLE